MWTPPTRRVSGWIAKCPSLELDRWSEDRDKTLATSSSGSHVAQRYGVVDLDAAGEWVQTDLGAVWKPKVAEGWAPFQNGRWRWYDALGYTWVSDEAWGWVPYHHGRWTRKGDLGWVWVPAASPVFKPGDVYWLYNAKLAGWGPLAPGEDWLPSAAPEQFLNVNTTYANFQQDAHAIDPAGFKDRPKEPLGVAVFALALPSPAFPASRLEATRPVLRVGATRVQAVIPGTTFPETNEVPPPAPPPMPPAIVTNPTSDAPPMVSSGPPPDPGPPGPPMQVIYPVPVYTGIVVLNPPEHPDYSRRNPNSPQGSKGTSSQSTPASAPLSIPGGGTSPPAKRTTPLPPAGQPGRFIEARAHTARAGHNHNAPPHSASHRPCAAAREPSAASGEHPLQSLARTAGARTHSGEPRDTEASEAGIKAGEQARSQACTEGGEQNGGEGGSQAGYRPSKEAVGEPARRPTCGLPTAQPGLPRCAWQGLTPVQTFAIFPEGSIRKVLRDATPRGLSEPYWSTTFLSVSESSLNVRLSLVQNSLWLSVESTLTPTMAACFWSYFGRSC